MFLCTTDPQTADPLVAYQRPGTDISNYGAFALANVIYAATMENIVVEQVRSRVCPLCVLPTPHSPPLSMRCFVLWSDGECLCLLLLLSRRVYPSLFRRRPNHAQSARMNAMESASKVCLDGVWFGLPTPTRLFFFFFFFFFVSILFLWMVMG